MRERGGGEAREDRETAAAAAAASPQVETVRDGGNSEGSGGGSGGSGGYWKIRPTDVGRTDGNFSSFPAMRADEGGREGGREAEGKGTSVARILAAD